MTLETVQAHKRMQVLSLWKLLLAAIGVHLVIVLILSPTLGRKDERSPEALLSKARDLRQEGKYDAALEAYQMVVNQKPPMPALFQDAEKEMQETRLQALDAKRKIAEKAKEQVAAEEAEAKAPAPGQTGEEQPEETPTVDLPQLPTIEGEL